MAAALSAQPLSPPHHPHNNTMADDDDRIQRPRVMASTSTSTTTSSDKTKHSKKDSAHNGPKHNILEDERLHDSLSPRPLHLNTIIRDYAYSPQHFLFHGGGHLVEDDDSYSNSSELDATTPDYPDPYRQDQQRRLSDPAESSTGTRGGGPQWTPGPWGGDGGMLFEDMEPLPSTAFGTTDDDNDGIVWSKKQHRKSRSFADVPSYERGRRRDTNSSKRGSHEGGGAYSDPAGREALRASRGLEPVDLDADEDLYALTHGGHERRARRDSHVNTNTTTLPSRSFHEPSDLPLDAEPSHHHSSPQRESLGPADEELFAGESLALYDFVPENDNELGLKEGETVMVSYRHGLGWLVAENRVGEQGLVPEQYVRLLRDLPGWDEEEEEGGWVGCGGSSG